MNYKQLTWKQWEDEFEPIEGAHGSCLFETFGDELEAVRAAFESNPLTVWTVLDGGGTYLNLVNGAKWINRLGYYVTKQPAQPQTDYFVTNERD